MELDLKDAYRITPNLMAGQGSAEPFHLAFARPQRYYCIAGNFRGIIFLWIAIFKHFVEKKFSGYVNGRPHPLDNRRNAAHL